MLSRAMWPLAFVFVVAACGGASEDPQQAPLLDDGGSDAVSDSLAPTPDIGPDATETLEDSKSDTPTDAIVSGYPVIVVGKITGAVDAEPGMIADGVKLVNETMKTSCFRDYVLSASWTETNGLTQAQIYDKLASGPISVDV